MQKSSRYFSMYHFLVTKNGIYKKIAKMFVLIELDILISNI